MATRRPSEDRGFRSLEILFNPWNTGRTTVTVRTVDYRGSARLAHRIGSLSLRVGRSDLVGLPPGEVTALLVRLLDELLSDERSTLYPSSEEHRRRVASPAPPSGATGATVQVPGQQTLPLG